MIEILRQLLAAILCISIAAPLSAHSCDPEVNRKQLSSRLPGVAGGLTNYNANDQISTGTYDANGNTTHSAGLGYLRPYQFARRTTLLVQRRS
ncbi:MAG TPA: hypothetical protein VMJ35_10100 [Dongiaceae bacterium]|nr:hypothetical protein [Dongiaceae bacterium]